MIQDFAICFTCPIQSSTVASDPRPSYDMFICQLTDQNKCRKKCKTTFVEIDLGQPVDKSSYFAMSWYPSLADESCVTHNDAGFAYENIPCLYPNTLGKTYFP